MKSNRWVAPVLLVVSLCAVGGIYWQLSNAYLLQTKITTHIELKVLDNAGLPVTGAKVFERDVLMGQTDSYGEWRRFARYHAGDSLAFRIAKRAPSGVLEISKNFAVPVENKGETVELRATLLLPSEKTTESNSTTAPVVAEDPTTDSHAVDAVDAANGAGDAKGDASEKEKATEQKEDQSASNVVVDNHEVAMNTDSALTLVSTNLSQLSERQRAQNEVLSSDVFLKLLQHFKQKPLNLAVQSGWLFTIQHLSMGSDLGLILLRANNSRENKSISVVKTFEASTEGTSNVLAAAATWAVENGSKGLPPRPDWKKHQMQVLGSVSEKADVFVAGFPAVREGANLFSFYAAKPETANVTVISNGQITARGKAQPSGEGKPLLFAIEKGKVAIRQ